MRNRNLIYIGIIMVVLIGSLFAGFGRKSENAVKEANDIDLTKYRSEDIPEDCRMPEYENDVKGWKEHLSHHQNTSYCLDYYK